MKISGGKTKKERAEERNTRANGGRVWLKEDEFTS